MGPETGGCWEKTRSTCWQAAGGKKGCKKQEASNRTQSFIPGGSRGGCRQDCHLWPLQQRHELTKKDKKIIIHSRCQPASQRGNRVIYLLSYELPLKIFSSQSAPSKITWYQLQRARTKLIKGLFTLLANETCKLSNIVSISNQIRRVMTELIMRSCTFLQYSVHDARDGFCAKSLKVIAVEARSGWTGTTHATEPL